MKPVTKQSKKPTRAKPKTNDYAKMFVDTLNANVTAKHKPKKKA